MQNYQNTPRVSTVQNQSRIQSLTFSHLSQPKSAQKNQRSTNSTTETQQSPMSPKNPTMDSNEYSNPEISHTSQQTATINPTIPSQSINQSI